MNEDLHLIYKWYLDNKRDLPWRNTTDPYKIWISEIILQQTRVEQGLGYYQRFITKFPDIASLATAPEDEVLKQWQGLGYYSRARNLHASARAIYYETDGRFPDTYPEILALKGIGPYTAAAIASIAFRLPYPVLDGNVYRFLSRYLGISSPTETSAGKRIFREAAMELIPHATPGLHNEALMEFGALHCTPRNPGCSSCPVSASCFAFSKGLTDKLPVPKKQPVRRMRYLCYYLIESGDSIWIEKRSANDIWKNLYQLPVVESVAEISDQQAAGSNPDFLNGAQYTVLALSPVQKHILSHQTLMARIVHIKTDSRYELPQPYIRINKDDLHNFPVPRLIEKLLEKIKIRLKLN